MYICDNCNGVQPLKTNNCVYCLTGTVKSSVKRSLRTQRILTMNYNLRLYDILKDEDIVLHQRERYVYYSSSNIFRPRFWLFDLLSLPMYHDIIRRTSEQVDALRSKEPNRREFSFHIAKHSLDNVVLNNNINRQLEFIEGLSFNNKRIFIRHIPDNPMAIIKVNSMPALIRTRELLSYLTIGGDEEMYNIRYKRYLHRSDEMWQIDLNQRDKITQDIREMLAAYEGTED